MKNDDVELIQRVLEGIIISFIKMKNSKSERRKTMNVKLFALFCCISFLLFNGGVTISAKAPTTAKVVFTSNRDGNSEIYVMNPDGSQQVNLTEHPAADFDPVWSPTGEQILFNSNRDGKRDLYFMDVDRKTVRKVFTKSADRRQPTWSPDGKRVVDQNNSPTPGVIIVRIGLIQERYLSNPI